MLTSGEENPKYQTSPSNVRRIQIPFFPTKSRKKSETFPNGILNGTKSHLKHFITLSKRG